MIRGRRATMYSFFLKLEEEELGIFYQLLLKPFKKVLSRYERELQSKQTTTTTATDSTMSENNNDEESDDEEESYRPESSNLALRKGTIISFLRSLHDVFKQLYNKSSLFIHKVFYVLIRLLQYALPRHDSQLRSILFRHIHTVIDLFSEVPHVQTLVKQRFLNVVAPLIELLPKQYMTQRSAFLDCLQVISKRAELIDSFVKHPKILPNLLDMLSVTISEPVALQVFQMLDSLLEHQVQTKLPIFSNENASFLLNHFKKLEDQIGLWSNST